MSATAEEIAAVLAALSDRGAEQPVTGLPAWQSIRRAALARTQFAAGGAPRRVVRTERCGRLG